jgi:hypothetical protein
MPQRYRPVLQSLLLSPLQSLLLLPLQSPVPPTPLPTVPSWPLPTSTPAAQKSRSQPTSRVWNVRTPSP